MSPTVQWCLSSFTVGWLAVALPAIGGCDAGGSSADAATAPRDLAARPVPTDLRPAEPVNYSDVSRIFDVSCTSGGCHGRSCPPQGLALDEARVRSALVVRPSHEDPKRLLVAPGDPDHSYLLAKLSGVGMAPGTRRMPVGGPYLDDHEMDLVRRWIARGASFVDEGPPALDGGTACPDGAPVEPPPPPAGAIRLALAPQTIQAGEEVNWCASMTVQTDQYVSAFHNVVTAGSHHVGVLFAPFSGGTDSPAFKCMDQFERFGEFSAVFAAQTRDARVAFPGDTAIKLRAGSQVILWAHFDNHSACPVKGASWLDLETVKASTVKRFVAPFNVEKQSLHIPLEKDSPPEVACDPARWHVEQATCTVPNDLPYMDVLAMVSHTHGTGRRVEIRIFDGTTVLPTPLYVNDDWQDPPFGTFWDGPKPIHLLPGQGLDIRCSYFYQCGEHLATSAATSCPSSLHFAPSSDEEMCSLKVWYTAPYAHEIECDK